MKTISIRIYSNGVVQAETNGIKGKNCTDFAPLISALTNSRIIEAEWTNEYYESEQVAVENDEVIYISQEIK